MPRAAVVDARPQVSDGNGNRLEPCDAYLEDLAHRESLSPTARALLAQSFLLHGGTVVRWPTTRGPLRVWLQTPSVVPAQASAWANAAQHGVLDWNGATPVVRLVMSPDSVQADVVVLWADRLAPRAGTFTALPAGRSGVIRSVATGEIEHAIVVLTREAPTGGVASTRDVHALAIHEVGHALGLAHSPQSVSSRSSVMASSVATDDVTDSDREALRTWYALPAGRLCGPS